MPGQTGFQRPPPEGNMKTNSESLLVGMCPTRISK
jgi:hypothetical protein